MAQYENYLEKKKQQTGENSFAVYEEQAQKGMTWSYRPGYATDYAPDEMGEMFDDRFNNTTYKERTRYYFTDHNYMLAKAKRYVALSNNTEDTDEFSRIYDNKKGKTRRSHAKDAALHFAKAWQEQKKQADDRENNRGPRTYYELYKLREKVMNMRLEGMLCAAKAKSRSNTHEQYLTLRAKLSCYKILLDQAGNLFRKVDGKQRDQIRQFQEKQTSLENKIKSVKASIRATLPSAKEQWQSWIDVPEQARGFRNRARTQGINISENSSKIAICLGQCMDTMKKISYPCEVLLTDSNGAPITHGELKKQKWNQEYQKAFKNKDGEKIQRFKMEALKRFEEYQVPTLRDLQRKGTVPLFMENPCAFMEAVFYAAPYYQDMIQKDDWYRSYAGKNPKFAAKVNLLFEMYQNFKKELLGKHNLFVQEKGKNYGVTAQRPENPQNYTDQVLRGNYAALYLTYNQAAPAAPGEDAASIVKAWEKSDSIPTEKLDDDTDQMISVVEEEEKGPDHTELIRAFDDLPKEIEYFNPNWQNRDEKEQKVTFVPKRPENLNQALELRKEIHSNVLEKDIEANREIKALNEYYDKCVKEFLKTESPVFSKDLMQKKTDKWLNLDELAQLRNEFTKDGLLYEELPEKAKEIYDYYSTRMRVLEEMEAKTGEVKSHGQRESIHHTAFLQTNLKEKYEQQVRGSMDCWSCAGSGILNHFIRREAGYKTVSQRDFRAFEPKFRKPETMKLQMPKDQVFYDRMKEELEEFTTKNRSKDRTKSVMGNPYMVSDFYLEELSKYDNLKNTAVRRAEFSTSSARKSLNEDPNVLHNMAEKFKSVVHDAIQKDSALTLLCGKHYVTIIGIDGDQLTVCDSNNSAVIDNTTYKVSDLFSEHAGTFAVELTWLESIEDPNAVAGQYTNLKYDPETGEYESEGMNQTECIGLCEGVEAWKSFTDKEEDIRQFYSEGIYLPRKFVPGVRKKPVDVLTKNIYRKDDEQDQIIGNEDQKQSKKKETTEKKTTTEKSKSAKASGKEAKKDSKKTAKTETVVFDVDTSMDMEDIIDVNPDQYLIPEHAAEFTELRKTNPNLTLRGYRYYRRFRTSQSEVQIIRAGQSEEHTLSKRLNALLLDVHWKSNGEVFPEYKGNKEVNEEWILSWGDAKKKKDRKALDEKRVKLAQDRLIRVLNQMELPPFLELGNGWIERQLDQNYVRFTGDIQRMSAMSRLLERLPDLKTWLEERPGLNAKLKAGQAMAAYVENYMLLNYGFSPMNDLNGCTMKAPLKKKEEAELEKQLTDSLFNSYVRAYNRYSDQEVKKTMELKKVYTLKAKLEYELKQTPEYLEMMAEEKEEREREETELLKEKEIRKVQKENPGVRAETIRESWRIQKLMQEVQKETEKNPENRKPLEKKKFPSLMDLKNGWVEDMFLHHTKELIDLMQNGEDEKDEDQQDAYRDLKTIISMEIASKYGISLSLDGKECKAGKVTYDKAMKFHIEKPLTMMYGRFYCKYLGLKEDEVLKEYLDSLKKDEESGSTEKKKDGEKGTTEKKKDGGKKTVARKEKEDNVNRINLEEEEDVIITDRKVVTKENNRNEIIEEDKKEKNRNEIIEEDKKEKNQNEIIEEDKKEKNRNEIVKEEEGNLIVEEDDEKYSATKIRPLTEEEQKILDEENKVRDENDLRPPLFGIAYIAVRKSNAYSDYQDIRRMSGEIGNRRVFKKPVNNAPMGAMAPLIQSIRNDKETLKAGFNQEWMKNLISSKSKDLKKREASQKKVDWMIEQNLGNAFNGFRLPSPKELQRGWLEKTLQSERKSVQLFEILRKAQGVPKLAEENEAAKKYCKDHPEFQKMVDALLILNQYVRLYLNTKLDLEIDEGYGIPRGLEGYGGTKRKKAEKEMKTLGTIDYQKAYKEVPEGEIEGCAARELKLHTPGKDWPKQASGNA